MLREELLIGIMADSHGQSETIQAALAVLTSYNCRPIYHLGDVCDSTHPETVDACVTPLQEHRVMTIKGNNDHAIVANYLDRKKPPVSPESLDYLKTLPLVQVYRNALFVHSLPFVRRLGLSTMIGAMGNNEAHRFCKEFPKHVLFRGHSHSSEIICCRGQQTETRPLAPRESFNLTGNIPCVVTCGSLTRGLCMIWNPEEAVIKCLSFK